jgi:hypothetical protein
MGVTMPQYDFAHPKFNHGFVEFPIKKEPIFETFCNLARRYRVNVIRSQMIVTTTDYTAKVFNRLSYIEIRENGKSTILRNENEMTKYFMEVRNRK